VRPALKLDLYGDRALDDPRSTYRTIRDAGPAVWLPRNRLWAIGRYADVKAALRNAAVFTSGSGVAANPLTNRLAGDTVLNSDGEVHARRRGVVLDYLAARRVAALEATIAERAEAVIDRLTARERFDAVRDFAAALPVDVVTELSACRSTLSGCCGGGREVSTCWAPSTAAACKRRRAASV
jgi:cytochrome P450